MSFSLNEVEAMAKRAARGAGHTWGQAEEASKATRWLCAQGVDGVSVLAEVLKHGPSQGCPLGLGVALSDDAAALVVGPKQLGPVRQPEMVLPFAAMAARQLGKVVQLSCHTAKATTDGCALLVTGPLPADVEKLTISVVTADLHGATHATRATPSTVAWSFLSELAHLTYAPATEESRRLGAGAGLSDND